MSDLTVGSLCTGIGGLDLAVEQHFDARMAWYSEIEPAAISVIEREWPGVPNLGDLTLWMMGYPEGWVDGLVRTKALKACGNAVMPQQALAALQILVPR